MRRNEKCRCGSGKKYKKCCLAKDREMRQLAEDQRIAQYLADLFRPTVVTTDEIA